MAMMMIAAMQQIADWLGKLGLRQYAQRFAENDIDFSILADLTDQDLKELGVSSLGHRRQLLPRQPLRAPVTLEASAISTAALCGAIVQRTYSSTKRS
jgi:hypothetical protein